jgi:hypothetical protein
VDSVIIAPVDDLAMTAPRREAAKVRNGTVLAFFVPSCRRAGGACRITTARVHRQ